MSLIQAGDRNLVEYAYPEGEERERTPLIALLVAVFIVMSTSVAPLPTWNLIVKGIGGVLALSFLVYALRTRFRLSPELLLYAGWTLWCLAAVLAGTAYPQIFWESWSTIVNICVAIFILTLCTNSRRTLSINLFSLLLAAGFVASYSVFTGEFRIGEGEGKRVAGIALNSNSFGFLVLLASIVLAYLWMVQRRGKGLGRPILIAGMILFGLAIVATGSRKSVAGLVFFYIAWAWFCYRKEMTQKPGVLLGVIAGLLFGGVVMVFALQGSVVAKRFGYTFEALHGERAKETGEERVFLYKEGFRVAAEHPFVGVGVRGFLARARVRSMTHSDPMEVLTSSGIPGLLMYGSILVVLWVRAGKIAKYSDDPLEVKIAQLIRAVILTMFLLSLGRTNYGAKDYWVVMGSFIGWSHAIWLKLRERMELGTLGSPAGEQEMALSQYQRW
ncbi:MAG TPA: O-antigen ligase family protein [Phycisphaerae bacterium]|nr:O-antigen ligase family protein [Phycisphaerae bacterium]